jgi:hypothetical protein
MKSFFFALALCALVCGSAFAGETVSVVNHGAAEKAAPVVAAPAPAPAVVVAQAPVQEIVVVDARQPRPIVIVDNGPRRCLNGRCSTTTRASSTCTGPNCQQYKVQETDTETARRRWLGGGYVIRNNNRTVVKPTR